MRTSARNQLYGKVTAVVRGAVNDEVTLGLPGGEQIVAVLTRASVEALGLVPGRDACALIKASWVMVMVGEAHSQLSARNQLAGVVAEITPGAVNAEVALELPGGTRLIASITQASVAQLGLQSGTPAVAVFKASSVILAVDS